jgi:hypothetical protein
MAKLLDIETCFLLIQINKLKILLSPGPAYRRSRLPAARNPARIAEVRFLSLVLMHRLRLSEREWDFQLDDPIWQQPWSVEHRWPSTTGRSP